MVQGGVGWGVMSWACLREKGGTRGWMDGWMDANECCVTDGEGFLQEDKEAQG